jgi:hypothetical protein
MMQACFFFLVLRIEPRASHFLGKHYHWSHAPNPFACVFVFEMGVSLTLPGLVLNFDLPASASPVTEITSVHHCAWLVQGH